MATSSPRSTRPPRPTRPLDGRLRFAWLALDPGDASTDHETGHAMTRASADHAAAANGTGPEGRSDPDAARRADAAARDESARLHDVDAAGRDQTSDRRDRAAERDEARHTPALPASDVDTAATLRVAAASDRAQAALDRARAAVDRDRAAVDRDRSAAERLQAGIDLREAHGHDAAGDHPPGLIAGLRGVLAAHDVDITELRARLDAAESELQDLRAIRDALTPPELPARAGLELAAAFQPAAERVGGDFYLVSAGPGDTTVLVVGDVVGHGLVSARRASFVRTAFIATAPFSDDPAQLLSWVNTVLIERAGTTSEFVTAACLTYRPSTRQLRWAYAGHPPALWLDGGQELLAPQQGIPLGIHSELDCVEGSHLPDPGAGILLYTDGLTEARRHGRLLGLAAVSKSLAALRRPTPTQAISALLTLAADHTTDAPSDDLCLLAARIAA